MFLVRSRLVPPGMSVLVGNVYSWILFNFNLIDGYLCTPSQSDEIYIWNGCWWMSHWTRLDTLAFPRAEHGSRRVDAVPLAAWGHGDLCTLLHCGVGGVVIHPGVALLRRTPALQ